MGSEQIHYEALRKQIIMDRRDFMNIKKRKHLPPYQPYYLPYELPKDDIFVPQEKVQTVIQAKPTVHEFIPLNTGILVDTSDIDKPWKYISMQDIHGNSSAARRNDNNNYSAKIPNRYDNKAYISQW